VDRVDGRTWPFGGAALTEVVGAWTSWPRRRTGPSTGWGWIDGSAIIGSTLHPHIHDAAGHIRDISAASGR